MMKQPPTGAPPAGTPCSHPSPESFMKEPPASDDSERSVTAGLDSDDIDDAESDVSLSPTGAEQAGAEQTGADLFVAEVIEENVVVVPQHSWPIRAWHGLGRVWEWCFGFVSLMVALAVIASIPVLQLVSLGYLLEVSGRVSRSGRLRDGFFEIRTAGQIGSLFLGTWLMLLPLRFFSDMAHSAALIDPESGITVGWHVGLVVSTWLMVAHIVLAWYCGGKLRHFFWPLLAPLVFGMWFLRLLVSRSVRGSFVGDLLSRVSPRLLSDLTDVPPLASWFPPAIFWKGFRQGGVYVRARDTVWEFVMRLRLLDYFWLGFRGFAGAIIWLAIPVLMIASTTHLALDNREAARGLGAFFGFLGSLLLAGVMLYLPFLQAHFAAEQRFSAMFEWREIRRQFRRAPIAFWFALFSTLLLAIPLYLLKIEFVPREVIWLPSLVFVMFTFPARLITGWALGRSRHHDQPRFFLFRWKARFAALPVVAIYAFIVYFTQYTSWYGAWSLFEQHAVLTPVPFFGFLN